MSRSRSAGDSAAEQVIVFMSVSRQAWSEELGQAAAVRDPFAVYAPWLCAAAYRTCAVRAAHDDGNDPHQTRRESWARRDEARNPLKIMRTSYVRLRTDVSSPSGHPPVLRGKPGTPFFHGHQAGK